MSKTLGTALAGCLLACLAAPSAAQWPPHPTPEAPRTPDGQVDVDGPVGRLSDGNPDFSGVWNFVTYGQRGEQGRPVGEPAQPPPGVAPYATFWELGYGFEDGLPYQPWARELKAKRNRKALGLILVTAPFAAAAHHSFRAQYDADIVVEVTGTITEVTWTNPHARFYVAAEDDDGETVTWDFELASPSALFRRGWSVSSLEPGMQVTVVAYRARNAPHVANTGTITFEDGSRLTGLGSVPRD